MKELKEGISAKNIQPGKIIIRRVVAVTSIIIFLILLWQGWLFYRLSALRVFKRNYIEYVPDTTNQNGKGGFTAIDDSYNNKDYKKVIELVGSSRNIKDNFIAGHAQLALNNPSSAITAFKKVIDQSYVAGGSVYKDAAEYNLILSYIRNRDYDLALELMSRIKGNPGHRYHDKMTNKLFRQVKMLKWR